MKILELNSTYEPKDFITFKKMVNLVVNGKVDIISSWNIGFKYDNGYDPVCGARLEFYKHLHSYVYRNNTYEFCSGNCKETFELDSAPFLVPSIIRLKSYAPRHVKKQTWRRIGVFKRDNFTCQYCGKTCTPSELTIDHVTPKCMGGINSWENCVASCNPCNNLKADRTPQQAGMKLLHKPFAMRTSIWNEYNLLDVKHEDWVNYFK